MTTETQTLTHMDCNWYDPATCEGSVDYHVAMSPTGINYAWCERHFDERWALQEQTSHRYGVPLTYYGNEDMGWDDDYSDY